MKRIADLTSLENRYPEIYNFLESYKDIKHLFDFTTSIGHERKLLYKTLYKGIGNTGVYTIGLNNNNTVKIKMEYLNAMGNTHYSRFWIPFLFVSEALGLIKPGDTLIEVTSGNAGIALSICAKELGYKVKIIAPSNLPKSGRINPMLFYGADVHIVEGYISECMYKLKREIVSTNYFATNHSEEKSNFIIKIMNRISHEFYINNGIPDYVISGIGNGTSTISLFNYFKKNSNNNNKPYCIGYYPKIDDKRIVLGLYKQNTKLRHVKEAIKLSDTIVPTDELDIDILRDLFKFDTEIANLGPSSLYGLAIANNIAENVENKTFMIIGYDKIYRYKT